MSTGDDIKMTEEEAFSYLQDNLHMTSAKQRRQANRESFLDEIVVAIHRHLPWHTVKNLNTPQEKRHLPTLEEIKEDMYEGTGRPLLHTQRILQDVASSVGFEVAYVPSDVRGYKDVHILLMVRHLTAEGSSHMVDVGSSSPLFFHFFRLRGETSPVYQDSFLRYRFVRQGDSVVQIMLPPATRIWLQSLTGQPLNGLHT
nr:uncharacterized protein LOC129277265 [Lytechinus pictus]